MSETEFSREVAALRPALALTAQRYLHDAQAAEDIVQDALLRLWQIRDTLQSPIQAFAQVLVRNLSIDAIRRRHPKWMSPRLPRFPLTPLLMTSATAV